MSKNTTTEFSLNGRIPSGGASNSQSNSLITEQEIQGTPFKLINQGEDHFITWGEYLVTPRFKSEKECTNYFENEEWKVMCTFVMVVMDARDKIKNQLTHPFNTIFQNDSK